MLIKTISQILVKIPTLGLFRIKMEQSNMGKKIKLNKS